MRKARKEEEKLSKDAHQVALYMGIQRINGDFWLSEIFASVELLPQDMLENIGLQLTEYGTNPQRSQIHRGVGEGVLVCLGVCEEREVRST